MYECSFLSSRLPGDAKGIKRLQKEKSNMRSGITVISKMQKKAKRVCEKGECVCNAYDNDDGTSLSSLVSSWSLSSVKMC